MVVTDKYIFFWRGVFSNFYPTNFKTQNIFSDCFSASELNFKTSEQYFMFRKACHFEDYEVARLILVSDKPAEAQKLGRQVKNYSDEVWDAIRFDMMVEANRLKWQSKNIFTEILQLSGNKILVEASPIDKIWGVGLGELNPDILDESKWKGQNLLGKVLMKVRDELV